MTRHNTRDIFPATGTELSAKSWLTEAPLRMPPGVKRTPCALSQATAAARSSTHRRLAILW